MLQLYLYAQSNGKTTLTLDEVSSSSIPVYNKYDKSCKNELFDPAAFYVFHILCWVLPIAFYLFISLIIQSCRPKIRHMLDPPTPRSSNNHNFAAFILVGLIFSTYVIICDALVIIIIAGDSELNSLKKYEESIVHKFTKASIIVIVIFDILFSCISLINIFILFCIDISTCKCCKTCNEYSQRRHIFCFFLAFLWRILDHQQRDNNYIELTPLTERTQSYNANILKDITSETRTWLLMISFVAPIVCLGTHSGFVLIAWASDPVAAGSMTIFFVLSFLYYFFGFRQLYIVLASRFQSSQHVEDDIPEPDCNCLACVANRNNDRQDSEDRTCTTCHNITCKRYTITEIGEELDQHHDSLKHFNFKVLCCILPLALILISAHGLSIAAYVLLPSSSIAVPSSLLNILHWVLIIGSGLIAYKLLTFHSPYEEILGKNLLKSYDPTITSKDYPKELGRILGEALKKYHSPTLPPLSTPNAAGPAASALSTPNAAGPAAPALSTPNGAGPAAPALSTPNAAVPTAPARDLSTPNTSSNKDCCCWPHS